MNKTVAERAAELGMDQQELVHALRLLSRRKLKRGARRIYARYYHYYEYEAHMTVEKAAECFGINAEDAEREIVKTDWKPWTTEQMKVAMFAFYKREGRWPKAREYKLANELPPYRQWAFRAGDELGVWDARPADLWERVIARDRRCTPMVALSLRNVLARKEAIERIGFETFIKRRLATVLDEHPEYGTLYQLPGETPSEPMVLLKVVNSTPEPDGTFANYYLRVPPDQTDVREALTWTFNGNEALGSQLYEPLVQT